MDIFFVTAIHVSHPATVTSYYATEYQADVAATELVNRMRTEIDPEALPPVDISSWRDGLVDAQRRKLSMLGIDIAEIAPGTLFAHAGFDVRGGKSAIQGLSVPAVDDRELSTVLAALRGHQRQTCPSDLLEIATDGGRHDPMTPEEIDDLCERFNGPAPASQDANLVVEVSGGLVQGIVADRPVTLRVVDYDVDGADPDELMVVPGYDDSDPAPATVVRWEPDNIRIDPHWIARLDDESGSGD